MDSPKLTILEEAIMLAIVSVPRYGTDISDVVDVASSGQHSLSPGTLYPALKRLERRGLIKGMERSEQREIRRGHNRRYYQVTREGITVLQAVENTRMRLRELGQESTI